MHPFENSSRTGLIVPYISYIISLHFQCQLHTNNVFYCYWLWGCINISKKRRVSIFFLKTILLRNTDLSNNKVFIRKYRRYLVVAILGIDCLFCITRPFFNLLTSRSPTPEWWGLLLVHYDCDFRCSLSGYQPSSLAGHVGWEKLMSHTSSSFPPNTHASHG